MIIINKIQNYFKNSFLALILSFSFTLVVVANLFCSFSQLAFANEVLRPRNLADLEGDITAENAQAIDGAQVAWADYDIIRRDFPEILSLTDSQINEWLIQNFAFIGSEQTRLNLIRNSAIPIHNQKLTQFAFRPHGWNRSAILEATDPHNKNKIIGMVDIKGFGHGIRTTSNVDSQIRNFQNELNSPALIDSLRTSDHSDGLMSLGEAIAETTRQKAAQQLFDLANTDLETVESYAIILLPFSILKDNGKQIPAALYLRQAHIGRESNMPVPSTIYTDIHGGRQMTSTGSAVDFGGVMIQHPQLIEYFGPLTSNSEQNTKTETTDPQFSKAWAWAHDAASAFEHGDTKAIYRHINEMLLPLHNLKLTEVQKNNTYKKQFNARRLEIKRLQEQGLKYSEIIEKIKINNFSQIFLNQLFFSDENELRISALNDLQLNNDSRYTVIIRELFNNPNAYIRMHIAKSLQYKNDPISLSIIKEMLENKDSKIRHSALFALTGRSDSESLLIIKEWIQKNTGYDLLFAISALEGRTDIDTLHLIKELISNHEPIVRDAAIKLLQNRSDSYSLNIIKELIYSSHFKLKIEGLRLLKGRTDLESLQLIKELLKKETGDAHIVLIETLNGRADSESFQLMKELVSSSQKGSAILKTATQAIITALKKNPLLWNNLPPVELTAEMNKNLFFEHLKYERIQAEQINKVNLIQSCKNIF